ncbi:MAG: hypothetical protein ACOYMN_02145 [Roseimicrobium sp.]
MTEYETLGSAFKRDPNADLSTFRHLGPEGVEVNPLSPPIIEVTPVNFYYVLVYAGDEASLHASNAMMDEGRVLKHLPNQWHLVQRGFN